ncbi:MAG: tyrosine/phenylalanine carboxypeptidase domain-containing protein [Patescibacteria group bacterium]
MTFLQKITPTNLLEEKEKFLADNSYNPQFIYSEEVTNEKLYKFGKTQKKYLELAQEILNKAYFGRNEQDLLMLEGPLLTHESVNKKINSFLEMHHLEKRYEITWSSSFVSRASITTDVIKLRNNAKFRKDDLIGLLYHEIGTHAIRRINYEKQIWYRKKKKHGFINYLKTEEGLASLHSLLPKSYKSAYKSAIRYAAVDFAQNHSFSETWQFLGKYIQDQETRWMVTLRQKRGIFDTSKAGGYSKDLVYFEGLVNVFKYLEKNNFDITNLYFGKMALEDVGKAVELNPNFKPLLPSFFTLDREKYASEMRKVGKENNF